ncbi:MAG: glycosyltransferase family 2 protein, partial [Chloroflexota bacterium]
MSALSVPARAPRAVAERPTYSVVAPVYNEEETLPHFHERIAAAMEALGEPFEVLLINDGSRDNSYSVMRGLVEKDPRVRVVNFSRNFGHQMAVSAGLDHARGDAVVIIDSDLQDPPEVIAELAARWKEGAE